uniref:Leucine-rich repeat-containing N-terminal plant-type domain-containing protein n=1 Tax=Setaria viridis TaxID=4556 RepID=A0A4U6WCT0_SETVI|nr:hypothetical protein SEVIR_1G237534v2 [Setaria viridis]
MLRARLSRGNKGLMSPNDPAKLGMLTLLFLLLSYGVCNASCSTIPDNSTDMLSLLDFKRAITNNPGGLQQLDLSSNNLGMNRLEANDRQSWEFIDRLSNYSNLLLLSLTDNHFEGRIPDSIGNLSNNLQVLGLGTVDVRFRH